LADRRVKPYGARDSRLTWVPGDEVLSWSAPVLVAGHLLPERD
jgi:hypothetical protein